MALCPRLAADAWNRKSEITFSQPVQIPGVHLKGFAVLPAGTYVFKMMDSPSNRHIVQIFNKDQDRIYATILAIPNYRLEAPDKTEMTFYERPAGQPQALQAWFYPGRRIGAEFIYPKKKAMELAKEVRRPVPFAQPEPAEEVEQPIEPADKPQEPKIVAELKRAPVLSATPEGKEMPVEEAKPPVPPKPVSRLEAVPAPPEKPMLPATASPVPLTAFWGFLALGGVLALWGIERKFR